MTDKRFDGRAVVVTGAGGGIGAALARGFAAEGATVACVDIEGARAAEEADRIEGAWSWECDAARRDQVEALAARCEDRMGGCDVLVANAGGSRGEVRPFLEMTDDEWQAMLARNLHSVFVSTQVFARAMARRGGGAIVVVSSQLSVVVRPGMAHYVSAKGAVTQLVKAMAVDLAPLGIRVNALAPGPTETPGNAAFFAQPEVAAEHARSIPLGRVGKPEEMVGAALYLASDDAAYTTGATVMVDGGYTIV